MGKHYEKDRRVFGPVANAFEMSQGKDRGYSGRETWAKAMQALAWLPLLLSWPDQVI